MMDFEVIRRRMAWRSEERRAETPEGELPAIEDGREVEDRLVRVDEATPEEGVAESRIERWVGPGSSTDQEGREGLRTEGAMKIEEDPLEGALQGTPERFAVFTPPQSEGQSRGDAKEERGSTSDRGTRMEEPKGRPEVYGPLFDPIQVAQMEQLQRQASLLFTTRSEGRVLEEVRPTFLRSEELKQHQEKERRMEEIMKENEEMKRVLAGMRGVVNENVEMKKMMSEWMRRKEGEELAPEGSKTGRKRALEVGKEAEEREEEKSEAKFKTPEEGDLKMFSKGLEETPKPPDQGETIQLMLTLMKGMQEMQKQMIEKGDRGEDGGMIKGVEYVRGQHELPRLAEWSAGTAPIDLNDWLVLIEPIMADLTPTSQEWWEVLLGEARAWYDSHVKKSPVERLTHEPEPSPSLAQKKWGRLEKRASTMLLMGIPETQREEMVATKQTSAMKIVCRLLTVYQPGGLAEKEVILRSLESPLETSNLPEAVGALRKWMRWRNRAKELGVSEPDASILLRGLGKIIKKPLEVHRDLSFRISLTRSVLQVDSTPNSTNVHQFATHLLAEMEMMAHAESGGRKAQPKEIPKNPETRMKKLEKDQEERAGTPKKEGAKEASPCRFFNTDAGCRKGKECKWMRTVEEGKKRCWICGAVDHYAGSCARPKDQRPTDQRRTYPKQEPRSIQKAETDATKPAVETAKETETSTSPGQEESGEVMRGLLEEANKMLRALKDTKEEEMGEREGKLKRLQRQLDELKSIKVFRIASLTEGGGHGLLDSGATHALRGKKDGESTHDLPEVKVNLACGRETLLRMTPGGTMIAPSSTTEPIVPLGKLVRRLGCHVGWGKGGLTVTHPRRGKLRVFEKEGCPHVEHSVALELIEELEKIEAEKCKGVRIAKAEVMEAKWIEDLVEAHPVLRTLTSEVKEALKMKPAADLRGLPQINRRRRKRILREGALIHLYAGENEGYTLARAMKEVGADRSTLVEVDLLRGGEHDMMKDQLYSSLLRLALDGKMRSMVGGPNCRTRSVLRHYPVEGVEGGGPRPLRAWGGEEFGKRDLTPSEAHLVWEDDVLLWRMMLIYIVAEEVNKVEPGKKKMIGFGIEQPAYPEYMPEVVSLWKTSQWMKMKEMYGLEEVTFNQGDYGGEAVKPTTWGGSLSIEVPTKKNEEAKSRKENKTRDSKTLARWAPGFMREVARALQQQVLGLQVRMTKLSWREHIQHGHVPFRKDCRVCQESSAKAAPHRRVVGVGNGKARAGVLSVDTTGPLVKGKDVDSAVVRFLLVGAFTWVVPKGSRLSEGPKLPEEEDKEEEEDKIVLEEEEAEIEDTRPRRGRPRKEQPEEERMGPEEVQDLEEKPDPEEPEREKKDDEEEGPKDDFEIRVFRMATPMATKGGEEVLRAVAEMVTRLHLEGFKVSQIHSDHGGEFTSRILQRWILNRGIARTFTGVNDPQSNGRAENSVQAIKSYIRRALKQGGLPPSDWPLAARFVSEGLRYDRIGQERNFPPLGAEILIKKRRWDAQQMQPTMETVEYIAPSPWNYGHWVRKEDGQIVTTRCYIAYTRTPIEEGAWIALEQEARNPMEIRRRIRGKTAVRMLNHSREEEEEEREDEGGPGNARIMTMIAEEMTTVMEEEEPSNLRITMETVAKLRTMVEENPEEEVLQTKIVSTAEILRSPEEWREAINAELVSLLEEKEALKPMRGKEKEDFMRKAFEEGRRIEVVPGKLVSTIKPGPGKGKKKARIVACGNFTNRDAQDDLYASTGDAVVLRIMLQWASEKDWSGVSLDIKTAFLNTPWDDMGVLVKPPYLLVSMGLVEEGTLWLPTKALYGFRKSPRLWGNYRDSVLREKKVKVHGEELKLSQCVSEPNLWRIQGREDDTPRALMMVYVDDIFAVGENEVLKSLVEGVQQEWKTSTPEWVTEEPVRFLGMEVRKMKDDDEGYKWAATQGNYVKDLLRRNLGDREEAWLRRKIPMTRDAPGDIPEKVTAEQVREAQRIAGELLWLVTRTRPDVMFTVAKMASMVLHHPVWVKEMASQIWGYLVVTQREGLVYKKKKDLEPWDEDSGLKSYADASFSPGGEESHGCVVVSLRGGPLVWRSSKQGSVTLSTAEAELNELIEGLMLGESVAAVVEELEPNIMKLMISDSQAAVNIVLAEGGSWRTRHLRLRAAHAKQRFTKGDWALRHRPGEEMIADIGTKALTASRLQFLKGLLGMEEVRKLEDEERKKEEEKNEERLVKGGPEVETVLRMVVTLAAVTVAKAQGEEVQDRLSVQGWMLMFFAVLSSEETTGSVVFGGVPMVPPLPQHGGDQVPQGMYITRWGEKFHVLRLCRCLAKSRLEISPWCPLCRGDELNPRAVYSQGVGAVAHVSANCPRLPPRRSTYLRCGLCG